MDDIVQQAMAKWPNVPAVFGWLSLTRRGEWRIKGEKISNPIVSEFINRNYTHDEQGRWFFQNGPQRVYVSLDYTPMVYRYADSVHIETHTGIQAIQINGAYIDDGGSLLLNSELGIGIVDDRDLNQFLTLLADAHNKQLTDDALKKLSEIVPKHWRNLKLRLSTNTLNVEHIPAAYISTYFSFNPNPRQPAAEDEC